MKKIFLGLAAGGWLFLTAKAEAQVSTQTPDEAPRQPAELLKNPFLPNSEINEALGPGQAQGKTSPPKIQTVSVQEIEVVGNTVLSPSEIDEAFAPFIGQELSYAELLQIRSKITNLYVDKGYETSGAFLPPQELTDGRVKIQAVEGKLEKIEIEGLKRLDAEYVRSRIASGAGAPLNSNNLREVLAKLEQNPLIESVSGELVGGSAPNRTVLQLRLVEAPAFQTQLRVDNATSPSVGEVGGTLSTNYQLLGWGDILSFQYGRTDGSERYQGGYSFPFNLEEGTFSVSYTDAESEVSEDFLSALDLQGEYEALNFAVRQPVISTPTEELALELSAERIRTETVIQDVSFPFVEGLDDGEARLSVLRFSQDWAKREANSLLTVQSQFSVGVDVFEATVTERGIDGLFWSWQGQAQWVQALNKERDALLVTRLGAQLTPNTLLPVEQFTLGGWGSVRGYRQNQQVADNGIFGSVELRIPVVRESGWGLQVAPFIDAGTAWNNDRETTGENTLAAVGMGLRWQLGDFLEAQLDYGVPLVEAEEPSNSIAGEGFHFLIQSRFIKF